MLVGRSAGCCEVWSIVPSIAIKENNELDDDLIKTSMGGFEFRCIGFLDPVDWRDCGPVVSFVIQALPHDLRNIYFWVCTLGGEMLLEGLNWLSNDQINIRNNKSGRTFRHQLWEVQRANLSVFNDDDEDDSVETHNDNGSKSRVFSSADDTTGLRRREIMLDATTCPPVHNVSVFDEEGVNNEIPESAATLSTFLWLDGTGRLNVSLFDLEEAMPVFKMESFTKYDVDTSQWPSVGNQLDVLPEKILLDGRSFMNQPPPVSLLWKGGINAESIDEVQQISGLSESLPSWSFDASIYTCKSKVSIHLLGPRQQILNQLAVHGPWALSTSTPLYKRCLDWNLIPIPQEHKNIIQKDGKEEESSNSKSVLYHRNMLLSLCLETNLTSVIVHYVNELVEIPSTKLSNAIALVASSDHTEYLVGNPKPVLVWAWNTARFIVDRLQEFYEPLFVDDDVLNNSSEVVDTSVMSTASRTRTADSTLSILTGLHLRLCNVYKIFQALATRDSTPEGLDVLEEKSGSVALEAQYVELILWCINAGLLPELRVRNGINSLDQNKPALFETLDYLQDVYREKRTIKKANF